MHDRQPAVAAGILVALTAPLGIAVHLLSELVGLGWHDDADVVFSARHAYLAAIAVAALVGSAFALGAIRPDRRRGRVEEIVAALPFHGRGARFVGLSFFVQFGFFALTQLGEGCPLCGGDVFVGVLAAAAAALAGAFLVTCAKRRLLAFAIGLAWFRTHDRTHRLTSAHARSSVCRLLAAGRRSPVSFRNRPPPRAD